MKNSYFLLVILILVGCSKEQSFDSSDITNFKWVTSKIILSESLDVNDDGNVSFDLLDELPCYAETITFNSLKVEISKRIILFFYNSNDLENCYLFNDCEDSGIAALEALGNYEMIDNSTIKINVTASLISEGDLHFEYLLKLVGNRLTWDSHIELPVRYNEQNECYEIEPISAYFEFEKY